MKLQKHWFRNILFIICAFVVGFYSVFAAHGTVTGETLVTLENCQPQTWVGIVRWLNNKTDYEDVPNFELKYAGSISMMLPAGDYAVTHYRPRIIVEINGQPEIYSPAILEFREVTVGFLPITFSFGCEE